MRLPRSLPGPGGAARRAGAAALVLAALAFGGIGAWLMARAEARHDADARGAAAVQAQAATTVVLGQTASGLLGAQAIVGTDGQPDADRFAAFASGFLGLGGIRAIGISLRVSRAERAAFEARLGRPIVQVGAGQTAVPAGDRADYFPVVAVEPRTSTSSRVLGFDVASDAPRGDAIRRARDSGTPQISSLVGLVQNAAAGVVVFAPLYRGQPLPTTIAERRARLVGTVAASFAAETLLGLVQARLPSQARIRLLDGTTLLAGPAEPLEDAASRQFTIGGRTWTVEATVPGEADALGPAAIAAGGALLAALVALLYRQGVRGERHIRAAQRRTLALQEVTGALVSCSRLSEIVRATLDRAVPAAGASGGAIALVEGAGDRVRVLHEVDGPAGSGESFLSVDEPFAITAAYRGREPVWAGTAAAWRGAFPEGSRAAGQRYAAVAGLPLAVGERTVGAMTFLYEREQAFDEEQRAFLVAVAEQIAQAVERTRLAEAEHDLAAHVQRALLPRGVPDVEGVDVAVQYLPASPVDVGGDWYDALALPDGRVVIAVGDVVGHGAEAAALMGQLRSAMLAIVQTEHDPPAVVGRVSALAAELDRAIASTLLYVVLDPRTREVALTSAGHPPPLVIAADGRTEYVERGRGLPLGISDAAYPSHVFALPPGAALLLYTDGAIERRGAPLAAGLTSLADAAGAIGPSPGRLCAELPALLWPDGMHDDDVALVALAPVPVAAGQSNGGPPAFEHELEPTAAALAETRRALAAWLEAAGVGDEDAFSILLATHEACANAVEHPLERREGTVRVHATIAGRDLVVAVVDRGRWRPSAEPTDRGRGLDLIRSLVDDLEVELGDGGTTVRLSRRLPGRGGA